MRDFADFVVRARTLRSVIPSVDGHIHTSYSDGRSTLDDYVLAAIEGNYRGICFTDHVDGTTRWFGKYVAEIAARNRLCPKMEMLAGIEVRARDFSGNLNVHPEILEQADIVIGVVHSIPTEDGNGKIRPELFGPEELLDRELQLSVALLNSDHVSVLGHPLGNYEQWYGPAPTAAYREIFTIAKEVEKAVEINPKHINDLPGFLSKCCSVNPLVSLGSDAHEVHELGLARRRVGECL
jgi:putative hydrolase